MYCGMTLVIVVRKMQNNIYSVKSESAFCTRKLIGFLCWHLEIF